MNILCIFTYIINIYYIKEQKKNYNTGLISLEIVAKFNQIDIDMRSIVRNYGIDSVDVSPEEIIVL